jgi:hypothetical protein
MAVKDWMTPGYGPRRACKILTVDPKQRIIQGILKDTTSVEIAVFDTPGFFIWPKVGENWTIHQYNGIWMLNHRLGGADDYQIDDLEPGEAKIDADIIKTPLGNQVAMTPIIQINDTDITYEFELNQYYSHYDGKILNAIELPYAGTYLANYKIMIDVIDPENTNGSITASTSLAIGSDAPVAPSFNQPLKNSEIIVQATSELHLGGMNFEYQFTTSDQKVGERTLKQLFALKSGIGNPLQPVQITYQQLSITPVSITPW